MILALDISARRTGWCIGEPLKGPPLCGSVGFGVNRDDLGALADKFHDFLTEIITPNPVRAMCFEAPIRPMMKVNILTLRQLYGMAMFAEWTAKQFLLPIYECHNGSHKKLLYGHGGKKPLESVAIEHARDWGFDPANHDEADACGVWLYTVQNQFPDEFKEIERRKSENIAQSGGALL